nr:glycosyltransferase family 2 protein [Bradyrhizobium neotropicale]
MEDTRICDLELSIVAPCYNEVLGLHELVRRCCDSAAAAVGDSYELILVDDGSTDDTWQTMICLTAHQNVVALKLSRNFGHQFALTAGLSAVRGRAVLIIDADLQDPPELLAQMLQRMKETSADIVYGQRNSRAGETWLKTWTSKLFYRLLGGVDTYRIHRTMAARVTTAR